MPLARKSRLLELTEQHGQFVIEDDYEAEISFNKTPPRALKSLDRWGNVIYVGSLSKSLLQGLRVGYLVADREFIREARALRHYMLRHPPVNNQRSVALFLQRGYFDRFIAKLTGIYNRRCDVMHESLERHFPGAAVKPEYGGAIIWLRLPEDVDAKVLHDLVEPEGVFFETGGFTFSDEQSNRNHIRLGYSVIDEALIPEGIDRIARAVRRRAATIPRRRTRSGRRSRATRVLGIRQVVAAIRSICMDNNIILYLISFGQLLYLDGHIRNGSVSAVEEVSFTMPETTDGGRSAGLRFLESPGSCGVPAATTVLCVLLACETPQPPGICSAIPQQTITVAESVTVSACFDDPNEDMLSYKAWSSDIGIATVMGSGGTVTVTAVSPGSALGTILAEDPGGLKAQQSFAVLVPNRPPVAVGEIVNREVAVGDSIAIDAAAYFREPTASRSLLKRCPTPPWPRPAWRMPP